MQTILITGASGGICAEACKYILELQRVARDPVTWHFVLGFRDLHSTKVVDALKQYERLSDESIITALACDLSCFASVRAFAQECKGIVIDVAIFGAGVVETDFARTVDGNERAYQINHLSQFLLLDLLQAQITQRVVFVGSALHQKADSTVTLATIKDEWPADYAALNVYRQSKLLSVYCMDLWHERLQSRGVKVVTVQPGFVPASDLSRRMPLWQRLAMRYIVSWAPFARSPAQAGETVAAVAIASEYAHLDNVCIAADMQVVPGHHDLSNRSSAEQVWSWSIRRTRPAG